MGFNPKNKRVSQMEEQAREKGQSLSAYIKQMILDLTGAGSFIPLRFKEASNVLHTLEQEAQSLEMPLEDYLKALLADRHRALYGGNQQASLWYPKVQLIEREAPAPQGEDEINTRVANFT
jgi:hypothetical protein